MKKALIFVLFLSLLLTGCAGTRGRSGSTSKGTDAPAAIAAHTVLDTIHVTNAAGAVVPADLTMDQVPDNYYTEPAEQGSIEKFYYTTNTYGLYGRAEKEIKKYAEVYLPYGYSADGKYDIVYLMHGAGGTAERFFGSKEKPRGLKAIVDNMIALGEIRPTIFVGLTYYPVNGQDREDDWDAAYTKNYWRELGDVLPQIESHYATYAAGTGEEDLIASRNHRVFGGYSMGAVTTYYRLSDSLRYFHAFLAMSGSLYWGTEGRQDDAFGAEYLMNAVAAQGYTADDFFIYTATGSEDFARDVVTKQINSEKAKPAFFHFDDTGSSGTSNTAYEIGDGEQHSGSHASDRYLYNALPVISAILADR